MAPKSKRPKVVVAPNTLRSIFSNTTPPLLPKPTPHSTSTMPGSNLPQLQRSVLNKAALADSSHTPTSPHLYDSHSNRDPESHESNNENSSHMPTTSHNSDSSSHSTGNIESHQRDKVNSSRKYWTVNVIGEDEVITEEKLKSKDVWNLQGKKVIIEFNRFQQGIGEGAGLIGVWLGELASDVKVIPMNFTDWRSVPQMYKKNAVGDIERHFYFQSDVGMSWAMDSLRDKRKEFRNRLKTDYVKINSKRDEVMCTPATGIPQDQWNSLVDYWFSPKSKAMTERNTQNRKKLRFPHTGGSNSIARRTHEMELETGQHIGRGAAFIVTHKNKDGSYVNDDAKVVGVSLIFVCCITVRP
ncbi:unnamed protein product [Cuscuta epithymum]|uniref:Uncharacterized protein n=1 Tax=Cuscuta epithymum TaxID=186058 RepID=A0AAV0FP97_9ASTE|nr:unnamed protein product [Cuscuta epithymum]